MTLRNEYPPGFRLLAVTTLVLLGVMTLTGCSDSGESTSDAEKTDHVWKDQTQAIDKARDVQRQLDQSRK